MAEIQAKGRQKQWGPERAGRRGPVSLVWRQEEGHGRATPGCAG